MEDGRSAREVEGHDQYEPPSAYAQVDDFAATRDVAARPGRSRA